MSKPRWGATESEWVEWDVLQGLSADLLPVVSNPHAKIAPNSTMKAIGKTPSRFNRSNEVVGIPAWTTHVATDAEVARWGTVPDYGICLQTRNVRALDIDVTDEAVNARIRKIIADSCPCITLPLRWRADSPKCLFIFRLEGTYSKRVLKCDGGMIEFLANGQQCVVAGTHVNGQRYQWTGLDAGIPTLTADQFEALMCELDLSVGNDGWSTSKLGLDRSLLPDVVVEDDSVSAFLRKTEFYRGQSSDGRVFLHCPWRQGHTGDSGETETAYFIAGSNGVSVGRFHCLHASCAKRSDADFKNATGAFLDGMEPTAEFVESEKSNNDAVLEAFMAEEPPGYTSLYAGVGAAVVNGFYVDPPYPLGITLTRANGDLPALTRKRSGEIKAVLDNVIKVLACEDLMGFRVGRDQFRDEIAFGDHQRGWTPFTDSQYSGIRLRLHALGFEPVSRDMTRDAVLFLADKNEFDSAKRWLRLLEPTFDGRGRVSRFMTDYMGAADTPYARAMSEYIWTSMAGRVLNPGCQADHVPVWVSAQGTGKSSAVAAMAPHQDYFIEIDMQEKDTDLARRLRGRVIGELSELRGLHTKELESIKAWVTRRYEDFVPKYVEFARQFPRRLIFIGTTNKDEFLADETGNRRWGPIRVGTGDIAAIARDRDQLWAEAAAMWSDGGIRWQEFDRLARVEHGQYMMSDSWEDTVSEWLSIPDVINGRIPLQEEFLQLKEVANSALRIDARSLKRTDELRLAAVLRKLGYERGVRRVGDKMTKGWVKT